MRDEHLRVLERAAATGGVNDAARLYAARLRVGEVPLARLRAAAVLGDAAAQIALGEQVSEARPMRVRVAKFGGGRRLHGYWRPEAPFATHSTPRQARSFCGRRLATLGHKDQRGIPTCRACLRSEQMMLAYTETVSGPADDVTVLDPVAGLRCALAIIGWARAAWIAADAGLDARQRSMLHVISASTAYVRADCPRQWAFRPYVGGTINYQAGDINLYGPNPVVLMGHLAAIPHYHAHPLAWDPGGFHDSGPDTWLTLLSNTMAALWTDRYDTKCVSDIWSWKIRGAGQVVRACLQWATISDQPGELGNYCDQVRVVMRDQVCPWLVGNDDPLDKLIQPPSEEANEA